MHARAQQSFHNRETRPPRTRAGAPIGPARPRARDVARAPLRDPSEAGFAVFRQAASRIDARTACFPVLNLQHRRLRALCHSGGLLRMQPTLVFDKTTC